MRRAWVLILAGACRGPAPELAPLPRFGTTASFVERAQPVLVAGCANPSCHGNAERPLSLFAVHRYRLEPADTWVDAPLTAAEEQHNFLQCSAFLLGLDTPEHSQLLTKPLAVRAGGSGHSGVEVFVDREDYDYRRLLWWVETALAERSGP